VTDDTKCRDYQPDHNGECLNCDGTAADHEWPSLCGRCYDDGPTFPANCAERPELLAWQAIGMYHCPDCGAMVVAGWPHPELCRLCIDRNHPGFDA
jgi:hypothetical protein